MLFLDTWQIDELADRHKDHPTLGKATRLLAAFRDLVNANSDGWTYWRAPVQAAEKLQLLVSSPETATEELLRKAVTPLKSFCTRYKLKFPGLVEPVSVTAFVAIARRYVGGKPRQKARFHQAAEVVLGLLAEALEYRAGDYEIRHNEGGPAVSGEIILHSDVLYVQFSQTSLGPDAGFLWRTCMGRRDTAGGSNRWAKWESLLELPKLAATMQRVVTVVRRRANASA